MFCDGRKVYIVLISKNGMRQYHELACGCPQLESLRQQLEVLDSAANDFLEYLRYDNRDKFVRHATNRGAECLEKKVAGTILC